MAMKHYGKAWNALTLQQDRKIHQLDTKNISKLKKSYARTTQKFQVFQAMG